MGSASWMSVYCGPRDTLQPTPGSGSFAARQVPALALLEATGLWAFEEKHDGCWADARVEQGMLSALTSRVGLPLTCDLVGQTIAGLEGFTGRLVGELVADVVEGQEGPERTGTRRLFFFDVVAVAGADVRGRARDERRALLERIVQPAAVLSDRIRLVEARTVDIGRWYLEVLARGGEGLVAKLRTASAITVRDDGKVDTQIRVKPEHTVDYVVMAIGRAKTAKRSPNLVCGLYRDGQLRAIGAFPVPSFWRELDRLEDVIGGVVEAKGMEILPSGYLRNGQLQRPRTDKRPEDCTLPRFAA